MFKIANEKFEYIPVQYNMYWINQREKNNISAVKQEFIKELLTFCKKNNGKIIIWDFYNCSYINDRIFKDAFDKLVQYRCKVILANIDKNTVLEKEIKCGLTSIIGNCLSAKDKWKCHYIVGDKSFHEFTDFTIDHIHRVYFSTIIDGKCIETDFQYLVSSGVYSNMQINLKKIFSDVENFSYVIYLLWKEIHREEMDGIIATSKNGVAFASILGEIIGSPVLYYNIGQMFEETYGCSPEIKENGKYIHIYDMICLGSETKILNALVNAQGGFIIKSVGCVCLPDLEIVKKKNRYSPMNRVWAIVGQNDLKRKYQISLYNIQEEMNGNN